MIKKLLILLITLSLVFSAAACGLGEKAAEKAAEKALNSGSSDDSSVDLDGDKVTVTDDEGNSASFGGTDWPTSDAAKLIPKMTAGDITYVMDSTDYAWITIENIKKSDFDSYVSKLKSAGFDVESYTMQSDGYYVYTAYDANDNYASVSFTEKTSDTAAQIAITISAYTE